MDAFLARLASVTLVPLLVGASVLLQQDTDSALFLAGQILSIAATFSAIILVVLLSEQDVVALAVVGCLIFLRLVKLVSSDLSTIPTLYEITLFALMVMAGYEMTQREGELVRKQLVAICLVGLPVMIVQVLGLADWSHLLRTDFHGVEAGDISQYPTFLVSLEDLEPYAMLQFRPAGLFASNNALSLLLALAVGLSLPRVAKRGVSAHDAWLALACVLSMSKTVFATVAAVALWYLIFNGRDARAFMARYVCIFLAWLFGYFLIFPGLWATNVDTASWRLNAALRVVSLEQSLGLDLVGEELRTWTRAERPALFDDAGMLLNPEGALASILQIIPWYLSGTILVVAIILAGAFLKKFGATPQLKSLFPNVVVIFVCLIGLDFAGSNVFAVYIGAVASSLLKNVQGSEA